MCCAHVNARRGPCARLVDRLTSKISTTFCQIEHGIAATMTELLSGTRVLDLTNVLAGPYCGYQLALLGAEVIKVEDPRSGDLARQLGADPELNRALMGSSFLAQNAGKKSVALNLKDVAGAEAFKSLVATSDVVLENFRPGVMDRLGLGYSALQACNSRLIYCAISGFGQSGPLSANPAYDQIVQGLSGVMSVTGEKGGAPLRVGYPVCDTVGGLVGAFAIAAALVNRNRTGMGAHLDVSMLEATISALGWPVSNYLTCGITPSRIGNDNITASPSGTFVTRNGLINIAANKQEQFEQLCHELGISECVRDRRFSSRDSRKLNRDALTRIIESALQLDDAESWERRLNHRGVPAGRVLSIPEILGHPQLSERNMIWSFQDVPGVRRDLSVLRGGFRVNGTAPRPKTPPPLLGEHNGAVLGAETSTSPNRAS